ncbi:polyketide biosynthesis enoyl-CoA hydratase PksH [Pseudoduganella flava]|uniref:Enoyl-CoA hydratase/isomerase n=1 Tax=Pseudoduganella flava TaxID=871742 RepID=A0A562PJ15_9BURK|nr:enoyl-CoA hydratase/isomerase [Pseudoduganella flava]QGZ37641.1 enoyl-CoA hydratase/isomerase [Pseudoduganella flava]TWI43996.1 polyketide biosynthesis enoyl-CoA hydratase PksH [Pseudoduganella flava]
MAMSMNYDTLRVRLDDDILFLQMHRPQAANAIDDTLVREIGAALHGAEGAAKVVVLEGLPEVFCNGADFNEIGARLERGAPPQDPGPLYDLWHRLATGPFVSVAHVRGRANAGGIGFVAACDVVLCDSKATFSLSELLFGVMPACVLPFLARRIGPARANMMTLMTQPIGAAQALDWGLVDGCEENSDNLLRKQLLRLRRLGADGVARYKRYAASLDDTLRHARPLALQANLEVFSDPANLAKIARYARTGKFPWEAD